MKGTMSIKKLFCKQCQTMGFDPLPASKAFTLAEILMVILVVATIALMTIPNLIVNSQKTQTVTKLKKSYSLISEVFQRSTADNGMPPNWDLGTTYDQANNIRVMETYIIPYLTVAQNCGFTNTGSCKRHARYYLNNNSFNLLGYQIMLKDGTILLLNLDGGSSLGLPPRYIQIYLDLNGYKKPNIVGKDIFALTFDTTQNRLQFWGQVYSRASLLNNETFGCSKTGNLKSGSYCGALILKDGWKIANDYPW